MGDHTGSPSGNYASNMTGMETLLNELAPQICKDWRRLGRTLKVSSCEIEAINQDFIYDTKEKAFQTLLYWYRIFGKPGEAARTELCEALEAIGYMNIAKKIRGERETEQENEEETKNLTKNEEETTSAHQHKNGYYIVDGLTTLELTGRAYSVNLENILKELSTCDTHALAQKMLNLQNLEDMEKLHIKMIENYEGKERTTYYTKELENLKKESRSRMERTRQTICFTNYLLEQQQENPRELRTLSETLKRSFSQAEIRKEPRRNKTIDGISRPICIKKVQVETCSSPDDNREKRMVINEMETENDDDELHNTKL